MRLPVSILFLANVLWAEGCLREGAIAPCNAADPICAFEAFKAAPPASAAEAATAIRQIPVPIVRSAAVNGWLAAHPSTSPNEGQVLCGLLPSLEQETCTRRVNSPHLRP